MIGLSFHRWSPAALWRGRIERGAVADVFGHERRVLTHAVAGAFDLDDDGVVQQPVEQRGGDDRIAERFMMLLSWKGSYCNLAL